MSAGERAQHLRDFDADGPEKVRENIALNRYDRRTLARAVLWLEQRDRSAELADARRREEEAAAAETPRLARRARWPAWIAAAVATIVAIAAASLIIAGNAG